VAKIDKHMLCRMPAARAAALWAADRGVPPPPRATLVRWITAGVRGVRLNAERYGCRWYCRPADVLHFHARLCEPKHRRGGAA
jgi:hypothetical protein